MQALFWHNLRHFVATISRPLLKHERNLAGPAQGDANNEHLVRMGAVAARAAHELRSPLTTMAVLVDELRRQPDADDRKLAENLRIISDQIEACRHILSALAAHAQEALADDQRIEPLEANKGCEQFGSSNDSAAWRKKFHLFSGRV
jgi:two-component system sensor histidine kinase RegB